MWEILTTWQEKSIFFPFRNDNYPRRSKRTFSAVFLAYLFYLGPRLWTKLPKSIRDVTTLMSFKGKIHKLNISELLDDGCAGCSLCSSWFLYIFITNPVIRSCRYFIHYYIVFSLFSLLNLISSNWCPQISKGFFPG